MSLDVSRGPCWAGRQRGEQCGGGGEERDERQGERGLFITGSMRTLDSPDHHWAPLRALARWSSPERRKVLNKNLGGAWRAQLVER